MHRFTPPTPTSLARSVLITLFVESWEIECCAPPPVIGEQTGWRLSFVPAQPGSRIAAEHDVRAHDGDGHVLLDLSVVADWSDRLGPPPDGATRRGVLLGHAHGGIVSEGLPVTCGRVHRVRVVRERFTAVDDGAGRRLDRVPGTQTFVDVDASPRRFGVPPLVSGTTGTHETGVLIDVTVALASSAASALLS